MRYLLGFVVPVLFLFAGCGGSSGGASTPPTASQDLGSLTVIVDTRADGDAIVQFQLAGATLEGPGGQQTDNLLRESRMLTVGDPSGAAAGLRLGLVPAGRYDALHLMLVPGSGVARDAAGNNLTVSAPVDVRIPISDGLDHSMTEASWLVIGHDAAPLTVQGANATWTPQMSARLDGAEVTLETLSFPVVRNQEIAVTAMLAGDRTLLVDAAPTCVYRDEAGVVYPSRIAFLAAMTVTDDLCVVGNLHRRGLIDADYICRKPGYGDSRLIGRVLELDAPNQRFRFRVQAVNPRGRGIQLQAPQEIWVRTENARIEASNGSTLSFAALAVGKLAKVKWNVFEEVANGLDVYFATEVAIPGGNSGQHRPQWHARVTGVDVSEGRIEIAPRNNAQLRILGQAVAGATVTVAASTLIERQGQGGRQAISLADIQPGVDRIWVRGKVVGPTTIEASRVRVKEE